MPAPKRACKDCPAGSKRPAPHAGPRCASHHRAVRTARRDVAWETRLWSTYHITPEQYWAIYAAQGSRCFICERATGKTKKLAVDHDHACCPGPISCGKCVRGLLCSVDNKWLGHIRDEVDAGRRVVDYLMYPPASWYRSNIARPADREGNGR